ncbi:hypothetical protein HPB52_011177 [Rhipicephalus sanguineus]|uniref:Peptidase A2 domain-containing protein n=1 Tax=Rhipicephalus sanguineus TaxID=34632 RepID=A0A9D4PDK7_RHISA|nr:hypothetical protein HPB52_011177 [Rhipicephalus sanguineus]
MSTRARQRASRTAFAAKISLLPSLKLALVFVPARHIAAVCRKRRASVQEVAPVQDRASGTATVISVQAAPTSPRDLRIPVVVGGHSHMSLLVDTGATASLMTKKDFDMLFASKHRLLRASVHLNNFSKHRIPVLGYFRTDLHHHGKRAFVTFYVTARGTSLLTLDDIQQLGLLIDGATLTCRLATPVSSQLPVGVPPGPFAMALLSSATLHLLKRNLKFLQPRIATWGLGRRVLGILPPRRQMCSKQSTTA